jgi:hypothetical protein
LFGHIHPAVKKKKKSDYDRLHGRKDVGREERKQDTERKRGEEKEQFTIFEHSVKAACAVLLAVG